MSKIIYMVKSDKFFLKIMELEYFCNMGIYLFFFKINYIIKFFKILCFFFDKL